MCWSSKLPPIASALMRMGRLSFRTIGRGSGIGKRRPMNNLTNPVSHRHDPQTSAESARRVTLTGVRGEHAKVVLRLVKDHPGATAVELWAKASEDDKV